MYDVEAVRRDFPILGREVHGRPLVYLDNGASAQKPRAVIQAITEAYAMDYANVHRGLHYLSSVATEKYEAVRGKVQRFLGAAREEEIVFTTGSTMGINMVSYAWAAPRFEPGDEIVLSVMEHHANVVPWHFLRERQGAVLKWAPVDDDGNFLIEEFQKLLGPRTKMVAITHMSNALGTIVPVKQVIDLAHARGIPVLVDVSQACVHMAVDVQALDCDFYIATGHKLYGPSGIGVLYGKKDLLNAMPPFLGGGEMILDVTQDWVTYGETPHRFEAGTPPIVQAIGLGVALDYIMSIGRDAIMAHEMELTAYAQARMAEVEGVRIFGTARNKCSIVSFEIAGAHAHDVSTIIDRSGVAVRAGTHCTQPLLARFGVTSTCRASFAMYNTKAEADALVAALIKAREFFL